LASIEAIPMAGKIGSEKTGAGKNQTRPQPGSGQATKV
jgi:hypothetical protein